MPPVTLTEHSQNWNDSLAIDRQSRLVRNVALAGKMSRNGYSYSDLSLQEAAPLYADKPVFLDHADNRQRPADRSTRDLVGSIVAPRFVDGRIRGDIRVLDTESGEMFLKLVEAETPGVGMSHVVLAQRSADGQIVERIAEVVSVDVVINPATTSTFRESQDSTFRYTLPMTPADDGTMTDLVGEQELRQEVVRLQQLLSESQQRQEVDRLLATSGLPTEAITQCFREQLLSAPSDAARRVILQDRLSILSLSRPAARGVHSHERSIASPGPSQADLFIRTIRRR